MDYNHSISNRRKSKIVNALHPQCEKRSQNRVAAMVGVSSATISKMLRKDWELISDEVWRRTEANLQMDSGWNVVETTNMIAFRNVLAQVQNKRMSIAISESAGFGKSQAFKDYEREFKNVVLIECKNYWTKKSYVKTLLQKQGLNDQGTTEDLINRFISHMKGLDRPLVIIDQADKLRDNQLDLFIDFYNDLFGYCGFVLSGVHAFKKRILKGIAHDKTGYKELWSRVGSKFYDGVKDSSFNDIELICVANGVLDLSLIHI